jgi:hypothetical protein
MALDEQAIRARIDTNLIEPPGYVTTPNVISFSVRRARKQMSATFSASIKINHDDLVSDPRDSNIVIRAGYKNSLKIIFTGIVEKCVIQPVRSDASKIILNMSGRDYMSTLEGQKINRRLRTYKSGESPAERWGVITGITSRSTPRIEKFKEKIIDPQPKAILNMPKLQLDTTPEAFRLRNDVNKSLPSSTVGSLQITKIADADTTTEEGG